MNDQMTGKDGSNITFRMLDNSDGEKLGRFFSSLSVETKSKYGPHPLTHEFALELCQTIEHEQTTRFVALIEDEVVGYFILDFSDVSHEIERYATFGIELTPNLDAFFAPCISDRYQNLGISSLIMPKILEYAKQKNCNSIVLLGGTQETNTLGISFYKKWGFKQCGSYMTEITNLDMRLVL